MRFHLSWLVPLSLVRFTKRPYNSVLSLIMRKHLKLIFNDVPFRLAIVFNPNPKQAKKYFAMIYNFMVFTELLWRTGNEKKKVNSLLAWRDKLKDILHKLKMMISEGKVENTRCEVSKDEEIRLEEIGSQGPARCTQLVFGWLEYGHDGHWA